MYYGDSILSLGRYLSDRNFIVEAKGIKTTEGTRTTVDGSCYVVRPYTINLYVRPRIDTITVAHDVTCKIIVPKFNYRIKTLEKCHNYSESRYLEWNINVDAFSFARKLTVSCSSISSDTFFQFERELVDAIKKEIVKAINKSKRTDDGQWEFDCNFKVDLKVSE